MNREEAYGKILRKNLEICNKGKCDLACSKCAFRELTDLMVKELEDYF